jgi:hypothetical protein
MYLKKMTKWISFTLVLAMLISLLIPTGGHVQAATIKLNKSTLSINVGKTYTLKLQNASGTIKWTSSDKSVVTVSKGKIMAKKAGKANVTATYKGKSYKCAVTVKDKTVKVYLQALNFDNSMEDYINNIKNENPDYLNVKQYNDEYVEITMYNETRLSELKYYTKLFNDSINEVFKEYNQDIKISSDKLYKNVKVYTDSKAHEFSADYFSITLGTYIFADYIQAFNMVDVKDREFKITFIDSKTGNILYP